MQLLDISITFQCEYKIVLCVCVRMCVHVRHPCMHMYKNGIKHSYMFDRSELVEEQSNINCEHE